MVLGIDCFSHYKETGYVCMAASWKDGDYWMKEFYV
jgi:hypothetical protein